MWAALLLVVASPLMLLATVFGLSPTQCEGVSSYLCDDSALGLVTFGAIATAWVLGVGAAIAAVVVARRRRVLLALSVAMPVCAVAILSAAASTWT